MHVHLVVNPAAKAQTGTAALAQIRSHLYDSAEVTEHTPESTRAATELIDRLATDGAERVIIAGGDGTVHLAVNALAHTETALGIIPIGTGNDAATGLGISSNIDKACATALGPTRRIDLIQAAEPAGENRYAATVAIMGIAEAINARAETMSFPKGSLKYSVATMLELPRLRSHDLVITTDGVERKLATNMLAIANLSYFGGGMLVAPGADPQDGLLEMVSIGPANPLLFGALMPTVFGGHHVRSRHVSVWQGAEIKIEGAGQAVRADGEAWGSLPVTLSAAPKALLVAVPETVP